MYSEEESTTVVAGLTPGVGEKGDAASKEFVMMKAGGVAPPAVAAPLDGSGTSGEASREQLSSQETVIKIKSYQQIRIESAFKFVFGFVLGALLCIFSTIFSSRSWLEYYGPISVFLAGVLKFHSLQKADVVLDVSVSLSEIESKDESTMTGESKPGTPVYEPSELFHGPDKLAPGKAGMDLILLHGLQPFVDGDAGKNAWTNRDGIFWPSRWLPETLAQFLNGRTLRVYAVNYNAQASGLITGAMGVAGAGHKRTAMNLFQSAVVCGQRLGRNPFVVIAHSYGGIVLKSLVVHCEKLSKESKAGKSELEIEDINAATAFMANFRGYVFYGVPQLGSYVASIACLLDIFSFLGECVKDLMPFNQDIMDVCLDFEGIIRRRGVLRFAFGETMPIKKWYLLKLMVVTRPSAKALHEDSEYMDLVSEDHISMTKPNSKDAVSYKKLVEFLRMIIEALPRPAIDSSGDEVIAALLSLPDSGRARKPQFDVYAPVEDFTEPSMPAADFCVKVLSSFKLI